MKILYVAKSFGRYYFFTGAESRQDFINTLPVWEQKAVETYEVTVRKAV